MPSSRGFHLRVRTSAVLTDVCKYSLNVQHQNVATPYSRNQAISIEQKPTYGGFPSEFHVTFGFEN